MFLCICNLFFLRILYQVEKELSGLYILPRNQGCFDALKKLEKRERLQKEKMLSNLEYETGLLPVEEIRQKVAEIEDREIEILEGS